jgi:hypothetical protein
MIQISRKRGWRREGCEAKPGTLASRPRTQGVAYALK